MGGGLEPDRRRRGHLGAQHAPGISIWGHKPVGQTIIDKLAFLAGAKSLLHDEDVVPALAGAGIADD